MSAEFVMKTDRRQMLDYDTKADSYFSRARTEIAPLLPRVVGRVLEIGCGSGSTLEWLRQDHAARETVGIEVTEHASRAARAKVDRVIHADAENIDLPADIGKFDLVLCLDVLEHMRDPWGFLARIQQIVQPGGLVISSIPNVRHFKAVMPLLVRGHWDYQEEGILDHTHLRFFTEKSALQLMSTGELRVQNTIRHLPPSGSKSHLFNSLTLHLFEPFLVVQYLIASIRVA